MVGGEFTDHLGDQLFEAVVPAVGLEVDLPVPGDHPAEIPHAQLS
jgi:hypothetical protein